MNTDYVDEFENYDRKLIKLNSDTAILLHIFKKKPNPPLRGLDGSSRQ